ncbi:MAG: Tungsten-containing aldehyde ferredoxin oxidoreductase, alpha chain [Clostridiales bacterium 38_11]|nr:MAG: Tungsten-containing aldehyde ferredoxin oxidoreductase, alpha chain [Clostridiales bacterium 38_11]
MDLQNLRNKRKLLFEFKYEKKDLYRGYTDKTLYINLSTNEIKEKDVPEEMKEKFIGGKGYGMRYLWDAVTPETRWDSVENEIIVAVGPVGGITQYPGSGKSLVCTISPMTDIPIDSNVGGYFGPYLKFSGFDALEIQGKAERDVVIIIDGKEKTVRIEEAPLEAVDGHILGDQLTHMYGNSESAKRLVSVITAGTAAEHTRIGILNFTFYDLRRKTARMKQAGRGGIGTVFRNKKIKAVVVIAEEVKGNLNNAFDQSIINEMGIKLHREMAHLDHLQNNMRKIGTANIIEVMDAYDLLPVHNFQYGSHPDTKKIESKVFIRDYCTQNMPDGCWYGCSVACSKAADNFELKTGPYRGQKVVVDGPEYENAAGVGANCGIFDPHAVLELNFYCDTYGIDTISYGTLTAFAMECYERGIINQEITGGLDLRFGNADASLDLIHQMAKGEGFGLIAGQGVHRMKKLFVEKYDADADFLEDIGAEQKGLEYSQYMSKESLAQQGGYGLTNKGPQHDEAWVIFMDMINNQIPTFENKAEALHYFPMFRTWFGLLGLCKLPWNDIVPANNSETEEPAKIQEHVDNYHKLYYGITGTKIDSAEMIRQSERVYNFQRIFNIRMGKGLRKNDKTPYRTMGPVTKEEYLSRESNYEKQMNELGFDLTGKTVKEKIAMLRRHRENQYEQLTDAVYKRRGWTMNGVPTPEKLKDLGMELPELLEVIKPYL